jgi:hypothetical protein
MWYDPDAEVREDGKYTAWYKYRPGLRPEIWERKIEHLTAKTITLEGLGKVKGFVYSCPQDAITDEYEMFCLWELGSGYAFSKPKVTLGEASAFLQLLARLEFNLNNEIQMLQKEEVEQKTDDN